MIHSNYEKRALVIAQIFVLFAITKNQFTASTQTSLEK